MDEKTKTEEHLMNQSNSTLVENEISTKSHHDSTKQYHNFLKHSRTSCNENIYLISLYIVDELEKINKNAETKIYGTEYSIDESQIHESILQYLKLVNGLVDNFKLQVSDTTNTFLQSLPEDLVKVEAEFGLNSQETLGSGDETDTYEIEETEISTGACKHAKSVVDNEGKYEGSKSRCQDSEEEKPKNQNSKLKSKTKKSKGKKTNEITGKRKYRKRKSSKESVEITYICLEDCDDNFSCELCGTQCTNLRGLYFHFSKFHNKVHVFKCKVCDMSFQYNRDHRKHMKTVHEESQELRCPTCDKLFDHIGMLQNHIRTGHGPTIKGEFIDAYASKNSSGKVVYKCDEDGCQLVYARKGHFIIHMNRKHPNLIDHGKAQAKCDVCNIVASNKSQLAVHMKSKSHLKIKVGQILGFEPMGDLNEYLKEGKVANELLRKRVEEVLNKAKPFICEMCGASFLSEPALRSHLFRKHTDCQCNECGRKFQDRQSLYLHQIYNHRVEFAHSCSICSQKFPTAGAVNSHINRMHKPVVQKQFPCSKCENMYKSKKALQDHVKNVHSNITARKVYPCSICSELLTNGATLKAHMARHTRESKYNCSLCDRVCVAKSELQLHVKTVHYNVKEHLCNACGKRFATKRRLKIHFEIMHEGKRQYECQVCGKKFKWHSSLDGHMNMHSGVKPYKCPICPKTFRSSGNLVIHKKVHERNLGIKLVKPRSRTYIEQVDNSQ